MTSEQLTDGLSSEEAARRLLTIGANRLPAVPPPSLVRRVVRQLASPLIYVLLFAVLFDVVTSLRDHGSWPVEGTVIAVVVVLNAALGVLQEYRAEHALAELEKLASPVVWALRDGKLARIAAAELVPGDRVRVEAGERVPADGTFRAVEAVMVDESLLTGESVRVEKAEGDAAMSGTLVVRGKGMLDVTATGPASTMGRLATALETVHADRTPLERQLDVLGGRLGRWIGAIALGLAAAGILAEGIARFEDVVLFAVALAVAAIPEGMPAVVTLTLSLGVQRMARRHAVVRRLAAVEALGSVTVIATDKTGTLTENHMTVQELVAHDEPEALRAMVLANDADDAASAGDPLEVGLLEFARGRGLDPAELRRAHPRTSVLPFDSAWRFMRVTVERDGAPRAYLKGAPEALLARSGLDDVTRRRWEARVEAAAQRGQRVIALAASDGDGDERIELLGLALLWDPPRAEVPAAVRAARDAGVRVMMITGDHPATAREIARQIGIADPEVTSGSELPADALQLRDIVRTTDVFARVTPEQKLAIVDALKANGEVVAVTGDGVNDAPALKRADVGIAMGQRGSDVAREVADLVLVDDNFATLVAAIEEGRNIYENIQTFLRFTLSTNLALVLLTIAGAVGSYVENLRTADGMLFVPLTALQILWINFLGDGPPGLALAVDRNDGVMARAPRSGRELLDRRTLRFIVSTGAFKGLLGFAALVVMPLAGFTLLAVQTVVFQTEAIGKLVSTYTARGLTTRAGRNLALHLAVAGGIVLQVLTMALTPLRDLLELEPVDVVAVIAVVGLIAAAVAGQRLLAWLLGRAPRAGKVQHA
ncbi:MAG: cation-translocating P-type ATPase [Acidobacteriota bacterium]